MQGLSALTRTAADHWRDGRGKVFVAVSAGWFLSIGVRMTYPVLLPYLRADYDLSLTMAGFLLTVLWIVYAIGQIPGGVLADRFGEGVTMAASMAIAAGTLALIVIADSLLALFVGTALLGGAIALFGVVRLTSLADTYPKRVGTVHGFLGAVGDVGNTVLPPLAGIIAAATVWQLGFGVLVPLFVLVAVALWSFVPTRTSPPANSSGSFTVENVRRVYSEVRQPALVFGTVIMVLGLAISQAFVGFYPTYLIEIKGMSAPVASGLFALFFALGVVIRPLAGNSYDRIGIRRLLFFIVGVSTTGFVLLPLVEGLPALVAVTVVIAVMTGRGTITMAYMTVSLSPDVQNTGLGILRTFFFLSGAVSPVVFGAIADRGYFDEAFFLLAVLSGLTILVIQRLPSVERE